MLNVLSYVPHSEVGSLSFFLSGGPPGALCSSVSFLPKSWLCCTGAGLANHLRSAQLHFLSGSISGSVPPSLQYQRWHYTAGALLAHKWLMFSFQHCSRKRQFHQLQHHFLSGISKGVLLAGPWPLQTLWRIQLKVVEEEGCFFYCIEVSFYHPKMQNLWHNLNVFCHSVVLIFAKPASPTHCRSVVDWHFALIGQTEFKHNCQADHRIK